MQRRKQLGSAKVNGKKLLRKSKPVTPAVSLRAAGKIKSKSAAMAGKPKSANGAKARTVKQYDHPTKTRLNNPPVGLVTPETDPDLAPKTYAYDPHLDPQLVWAGKIEKSALTVDTISLHVHERIDPYTIMEATRTKESFIEQPSLFAQASENPPLREALDFYKHQHGWSNRLIAGDSSLVMNSLLEREGMTGKVQTIYVDPPYGIRYRSNFQPFVGNRNVADSDKDDDLTTEPEMIRAFRDTWELGVHSYLTYLRDRLMLCHALLGATGSIFVQSSDENLHRISLLLDEVFGAENFVAVINYVTASPRASRLLENNCNYVTWYARDKEVTKFRPVYRAKPPLGDDAYKYIELPDGSRRTMSAEERNGRVDLPRGAKIYRLSALTSTRVASEAERFPIEVDGRTFPPQKTMWQTTPEGIERLKKARRIVVLGSTPQYVRYLDDFPAFPIGTQWTDTSTSGFSADKRYVVQTNPLIIERCMLMTTDPGDLVLDPTCGSGTTAVVAEKFGRRWIACDTSRVALALTRERLMTATFDYYELLSPELDVDGGFRYKTVTHIKLGTIANNEPVPEEPLFNDPLKDLNKVRVTGPFTVEAVPSPMITDLTLSSKNADATIGRSGATLRESDWRNELLKSGVRGLAGTFIKFSRVEPLAGTTFIHAQAETIEAQPRRVAISFGPDYAPLEQRQVQGAWKEAQILNPSPSVILFAAFQFDPEAAKDIDEIDPRLTKMTFLKVQMNMDLLTGDLKKKRAANEGFWLIGRPDVELKPLTSGKDRGKYLVTIHGFDYYDVKSGNIESGSTDRIAMWMLDTDYDERSLFPRQIFFPMAGDKDGWSKVAKSLKSEIDEDLIEAYHGTISLPFEAGQNGRVAVKIIDDRGVESMRVVKIQ